jgi:uncharacterized membrane protein YbhN (UPF0104 family)
VAAALIVWLLRSGRLDLSRLREMELGWAFAGVVACRVAATFIPLFRWRYLCSSQNLQVPARAVVRIGVTGTFFGLAAPASLGLDAAKLFYGCLANRGQESRLVSSVLVDRLVGLSGLLALAVASAWILLPYVAGAARGQIAFTLLVCTGLLAGLVFSFTRWGAAGRIRSRWQAFDRFLAALAEYRHRRAVLWRVFGISVATHAISAIGAYFAFRTLDVAPPPLAFAAITPLVNVTRGIPLTPLGLGVFDSASELLYSTVRLQDGAETAMIQRFAAILIGLACGAVYLLPFSAFSVKPAEPPPED